MLRMIIADDEPLVRDTISRIIDWKSHGIQLIGVCRDGIETYNMILDEYPDIVLLDINMPGMSGLDLIERIRGLDETISFVIISGYERFDFAQRALQYGVHQYLLKPCSREQLLNAVASVKKRREKLETLRVLRRENILLQNRVQATMQEQFLNDILLPDADVEKDIEDYCAALEDSDAGFAVFYLAHRSGRMSPDMAKMIYQCVCRHHMQLFLGLLAIQNVAVITLRAEDPSAVKEIKSELTQLAPDGTSVTCAAKYYPSSSAMLRSLIPELRLCDSVYQYFADGSCRELYNTAASVHRLLDAGTQLMCRFSELQPEQAAAALNALFMQVHDADTAKMVATSMAYQLFPAHSDVPEAEAACLVSSIYSASGVSEIQSLLLDRLSRGVSVESSEDIGRDYIQKLTSYVNEHLSDPCLSLKWIAQNILFMNVNYVSKQFLRRTGEKFSSYVSSLRMERAKDLLRRNPAAKITDVAEAVGMGGNPQYFSQVFKKYTGCTPSQFSEKESYHGIYNT